MSILKEDALDTRKKLDYNKLLHLINKTQQYNINILNQFTNSALINLLAAYLYFSISHFLSPINPNASILLLFLCIRHICLFLGSVLTLS